MTTVAIDFGTSNTIISLLDPTTNAPRTMKFDSISRMMGNDVYAVPSLVFVANSSILVFGERVREQRLGFAQPSSYFQGFKRDLVADYQPPARQIDGHSYNAEVVSELFITEIWQQLLSRYISFSQVIFTVPVGAFERYLTWYQRVASRLDIPNVTLVDESTAAALGYAVERPGVLVLVVDFGGGTLDLSLVRTASTDTEQKILKAEVIAKSDAYVGGVDIDIWIAEHYLRTINSSRTQIKEIGWLSLLELAERLKIKLSTTKEATESWFDDENFIAHELKISRDELAEILENHQLLEQIRQSLDEVLAIAHTKGVKKAEIERVLLVGGSSQISAVQELIISYFGRGKVQLDKPFEAVAHGALALRRVERVEDYLRHSYAIRLWDALKKEYTYFTLFEKGLKYPCLREETLTLQVATDGQKEFHLDIGELAQLSQAEVSFDEKGRMTSSQLHAHNTYRSLQNQGDFVTIARLNPPGKRGVDRLEVDFEVNAERVLLATVRDLLTGKLLVERVAIAKL